MNKFTIKLGLLLLLVVFLQKGNAQRSEIQTTEPVSLVNIDSVAYTAPKVRKPSNALKWAIIPGGGQVYNKAWWKVPIVYGALLSAIGVADFNQSNLSRAQNALRSKCFGVADPDNCIETNHEFTGTPLDDIQALRNIRDNFDRQTQTAYIFIFITYLLQGVEAFTDAHLKTFDVEDDLGFLKVGPIQQPGELMSYGITIPLGSDRKMRRQVAKLKRIGR